VAGRGACAITATHTSSRRAGVGWSRYASEVLRAAAAALLLAALSSPAGARGGGAGRGVVVLDGERVPVRWTDGDTFRILGGRHAGRAARLSGVNALETYGPVHRWAGISPRELLAVAKAAGPLAAREIRRCEEDRRADVYGRLLVTCPDAAEALVAAGYAMVFAIDAPADERLLAAQRSAQAARLGMWAGGAPPLVPSSVHSAGEPGLGPPGAYDRIVDTRAGAAVAHPHGRTYRTCEEVCVGEGRARACLVYVPFERRYRNRPGCLRGRSR
jgi:endonuclease YncB( thermonuclease family)